MSGALFFLFIIQAASPAAAPEPLTSFVCQADSGRSFSIDLLRPDIGPADARQFYRVSGLDQSPIADRVMDSLPDFLVMTWVAEDGTQVGLEIEDYDNENQTAKFRLSRESDPTAPIVTKSFSNGRCLSRAVSTENAGNQQEASQ